MNRSTNADPQLRIIRGVQQKVQWSCTQNQPVNACKTQELCGTTSPEGEVNLVSLFQSTT
ncbi:hypothetical protein Poly41_05410 [Novipirellula artificiosorum]|uniref:Uncharacterized protein n=1 Tax=Novipirellula artificiosorum TaxID=2528016 RepID=A0A5C6E0K1_9BACT|nr:hypothetical protein Poly41_05410 [Novipirellula artificiosorum]